ncbi:hypothetical protein [Streptomyces sp. NPDC021212]|uniref:hypothetical protein n=1 Tax=Streptomyces sp. NPDC021212 TaxID=3365118 RepID=UPI0037A3C89F
MQLREAPTSSESRTDPLSFRDLMWLTFLTNERVADKNLKAAELGVGVSTLRGWAAALKKSGPAGLVVDRPVRTAVERADPCWVDMAESVLQAHVKASRPVRGLILTEIEERLVKEHGEGTVPLPARTTGYELLRQLSKGTNAFEGSTKGKRSIADAPQGTYGRLRATRPGEYVVLDTNRLDVFAMEPVTCRWVQCELTVAMDLYSRCIVGLRPTPVSTKSVDVAGVLYEAVRPREVRTDGGESLPYRGVPSAVVVDAEKLVDRNGQPLLPTADTETIIFDHGKVYLSNHVRSVWRSCGSRCSRRGPRLRRTSRWSVGSAP